MKYLIAALLLFASTVSAEVDVDCAFGGACQGQDQAQQQQQAQGQLQGQAQGQNNNQQLSSDSQAIAGAAAGSISGSLSGASSEGQSVVISKKYDAVSSSAAELNLAYCADGASAQDKSAGFSIGQVNYICEAVAALKVNMMLVEMELAAYDAKREPDVDDKGKSIADLHLEKAHAYMTDGEEIMKDVVSYVQSRRNTAGISAAAKDATWPVGLITLLFFLL